MDRADELRVSLPSLLNQDYPGYEVVIVDHSSEDGLDSLLHSLSDPRLRILRCPRPTFFNRSRAANIGVRYSSSDLLFFLDTGISFRDERHLSEIVAAFGDSDEIDRQHYAEWRSVMTYPPFEGSHPLPDVPGRRVYGECECHGLHTLVGREIFQSIGGLNEALLDWGYEDTDLASRLELCGYGRIPIRGLVESGHDDDLRVRFHREKSKQRSWDKNRRIADTMVHTFGPILRTQGRPGWCDAIEIDGVAFTGADAPQQSWTLQTAGELPGRRASSMAVSRNDPRLPVVSVVIPTKNAAEYLVGVLDTVLSQDYPNIECLVADAGSTDATLDILASYGDRLTYSTQADRGSFDAINRSWQASRGEILAWLNADDSWAPGAVTAAVSCFQKDPGADVVYGDCLIVDAEGRLLEHRTPPNWDLAYALESCHHIVDQPAAFIRRDIAERVGWLYPAWFHDWDLWRRVSLAGGRIKRVPYLLGCARIRVDNTQYRPEILIKGMIEMTTRFFAQPTLPAHLRRMRRRALSNCYIKIALTLQYGRPDDRVLLRQLRRRALIADPTNVSNVRHLRIETRLSQPADPAEWSSLADTTASAPPSRHGSDSAIANGASPQSASRSGDDAPEPRVKVSVVVPCRNDARYLPFALESILSQDYPDIECIVVDGASTDNTLEILKRYGDRIRWHSEPDRGSFDAINRGWQMSQGEVLAWLNADDLWAPGAVSKAVAFLQRRPDVDVLYGTAGVVDEIGRLQGDMVPPVWSLEYALRHCEHVIFQPASFMRRRILERVNWLYPAWCHDHDLWLRIARAGGTFERIPARLGMDRLRTENLGRVAELVIPAKIGLTRRFFAAPDLSPDLAALRPRAISAAYVRAFDYLQLGRPQHWLAAPRLLGQAFIADPSNVRSIAERAYRPVRAHSAKLLSSSWRLGQKLVSGATAAGGLASALLTAPRRLSGRVIGHVFARGNRELALKVDSLQHRLAGLEHAAASMERAVHGVAPDLALLTRQMTHTADTLVGELNSLRLQIDQRVAAPLAADRAAVLEALASLRNQQQALRAETEAQARAPVLSSGDVYGTPPTLRRIPGWHTYWEVDGTGDGLRQDRLELWAALKRPVMLRWLADLLVMIWPGNELSRVLFLTGNFEPNELVWLSQTLGSGMTMIDVGAHIGMYTMTASKLVGETGTVVSVEPSSREFQRLAYHVTVNNLKNVRCLSLAASGSEGEATLKIAEEWNSGHNTIGTFTNPSVALVREERVRTLPLDTVVATQGLSRVDLIKIDAEGHELQVLAGAVDTISRFRPIFLIEVFGTALRLQHGSTDALLAFFDRHRYQLHEFSPTTGELGPLSRPLGDDSRNIVALPQIAT